MKSFDSIMNHNKTSVLEKKHFTIVLKSYDKLLTHDKYFVISIHFRLFFFFRYFFNV